MNNDLFWSRKEINFMNNFISLFSHAVNEDPNTIYCRVKSDMRCIEPPPIIN